MSRHVWPLVKYSKLDPDPTDSMRWAFVSDTSLQVLIEENDSTILKVQVRHPEIIALVKNESAFDFKELLLRPNALLNRNNWI